MLFCKFIDGVYLYVELLIYASLRTEFFLFDAVGAGNRAGQRINRTAKPNKIL